MSELPEDFRVFLDTADVEFTATGTFSEDELEILYAGVCFAASNIAPWCSEERLGRYHQLKSKVDGMLEELRKAKHG